MKHLQVRINLLFYAIAYLSNYSNTVIQKLTARTQIL